MKIFNSNSDFSNSFLTIDNRLDGTTTRLNKNDINAQYHYIPIYKFKVFGKKKAEFKEAEIYYKNTISLPIFVNLKNKDQNKIITAVKNYFK